MTTVAAPMKARGSVSAHPAAVSGYRSWLADPASGADLTGPCLHGQSQDGLSGCPVTDAASGAGSRTAPVQLRAPRSATNGTEARTTNGGTRGRSTEH